MTAARALAQVREVSSAYKAYVLFALFVVYVFNVIDRILVALLQESIKGELRLSDFQLGVLGGPAFAVLYALFGVALARRAERSGRVKVIAACAAVWSLATAACGAAQNFVQLVAARVVVGIGESGCIPASHSLISEYFSARRRAVAIAIFGLAIPVGTILAAMLGPWIATNMSWRTAFVVIGVPGAVVALIFWLTVREPVPAPLKISCSRHCEKRSRSSETSHRSGTWRSGVHSPRSLASR